MGKNSQDDDLRFNLLSVSMKKKGFKTKDIAFLMQYGGNTWVNARCDEMYMEWILVVHKHFPELNAESLAEMCREVDEVWKDWNESKHAADFLEELRQQVYKQTGLAIGFEPGE